MNDVTASILNDHPGVARVRKVLAAAGLPDNIVAMHEPAATAAAAAVALGCEIGAIAKSIIFRAADGRAVLVITSGSNRVDERKVEIAIGEKIGKADAEFVRTTTGFAIGGVAPLGHSLRPIALMDSDLMALGHVWPAAGHPNTMFSIPPQLLADLAGATVAEIAQRKAHAPQ